MEFINLFKELLIELDNLIYRDEVKRDGIRRKLAMYIKKKFGVESNYLKEIEKIDFYSWNFGNEQSQITAWKSGCEKLKNLINVVIEDIELSNMFSVVEGDVEANKELLFSNRIFIIHGHDEALKQEVARFIEQLGLEAVILHEQANNGKTIIEKFEDFSDVGYAIALLTPDDKISNTNERYEQITFFRARQNVIFEMGFFIGKIGRERVFSLVKGEGIEIPSDYSGVVFTKYDAGNWKFELIKELKNVGYEVDANKAIK